MIIPYVALSSDTIAELNNTVKPEMLAEIAIFDKLSETTNLLFVKLAPYRSIIDK
jgi:hypothetical protein